MSLKYLRRNLIFISNQSEDTTIITTDGEKITTQRHLLSTVSPYLAALLSQADHLDRIAISVPFSSEVVRNVLENLGSEDEDCNEIESEGFHAAKELGIMFLNEAQTKSKELEAVVKQDLDYDDVVSVEECTDVIAFEENAEGKDSSNDDSKNKEVFSSKVNPNKKGEVKNQKKIKGTVVSKDRAKEHKCNTCDLEFKCYSHLSDHDKKFHPGVKRFLCDPCRKGFSTASARDHHIESVHSEGPGNQCPHCEKTVKHLSTHIKHLHAIGGEKFTCEECGKTFRTKNYLSKHMRYHLPDEDKMVIMNKYQCNDCGEGFIDKTRLKWHEAVKHTGIKSFHCQHCPKSYFRPDHLKTHVTSTHKM